jgi:hypothetical protein
VTSSPNKKKFFHTRLLAVTTSERASEPRKFFAWTLRMMSGKLAGHVAGPAKFL